MSLLSEKLAPIWSAINRLQARQMSIFPATVTDIDPVRIRIDGESQSVAASPDALIPAGPGVRVRVLRYGTTHMILGRVGGLGAMLLDSGTLPAAQYATLHIPQHLRGRFSHYEIVLRAGAASSPGTTIQPVSVRINGDSGPNYRSQARAIDHNGDVVGSYNNDGISLPRTAYVGQYGGAAKITLVPFNPASGGYVTWHSEGWGHNGPGGNFMFTAGGRFSGASGVITHFDLLTNSPSTHWQDTPRARLWGYR